MEGNGLRRGFGGVFLMWLMLSAGVVLAHPAHERSLESINQQLQAEPPYRAALYLERAELYRQHRDWPAAKRDYATAQELAPDDLEVYFLRGRALLEAGSYAEAKRELDRFIAANPEHAQARISRARVAQALNDLSTALEDFNVAIEQMQPKIPSWYLERAQLLAVKLGSHDRAISSLDEGIQQMGPLVGLLKTAIDLEMAEGHFEHALTRMKQLPPRLYYSPLWMLRRGKLNKMAHHEAQAQQLYCAALKKIDALPPTRRRVQAMQVLKQQLQQSLSGSCEP